MEQVNPTSSNVALQDGVELANQTERAQEQPTAQNNTQSTISSASNQGYCNRIANIFYSIINTIKNFFQSYFRSATEEQQQPSEQPQPIDEQTQPIDEQTQPSDTQSSTLTPEEEERNQQRYNQRCGRYAEFLEHMHPLQERRAREEITTEATQALAEATQALNDASEYINQNIETVTINNIQTFLNANQHWTAYRNFLSSADSSDERFTTVTEEINVQKNRLFNIVR